MPKVILVYSIYIAACAFTTLVNLAIPAYHPTTSIRSVLPSTLSMSTSNAKEPKESLQSHHYLSRKQIPNLSPLPLFIILKHVFNSTPTTFSIEPRTFDQSSNALTNSSIPVFKSIYPPPRSPTLKSHIHISFTHEPLGYCLERTLLCVV